MSYLENNKLLTPHQYGYRNKRSTSHAATKFVDDVRREMENGLMVGAVFVDLSRAFDTLGHATLMTKLKSYKKSLGLTATYSTVLRQFILVTQNQLHNLYFPGYHKDRSLAPYCLYCTLMTWLMYLFHQKY